MSDTTTVAAFEAEKVKWALEAEFCIFGHAMDLRIHQYSWRFREEDQLQLLELPDLQEEKSALGGGDHRRSH